MQCKEFSTALEQQGLSPLSAAAQDHLSFCSSCQDLLADFSAIVAVAQELPAEGDPPQRVWVSLRAQLEAEGLIKEPSIAVMGTPSSNWLQNFRAWFAPRTLATAGAGIALAIAAFLQLHKPNTPIDPSVARQQVQKEAPQQVASQQTAPPPQQEVQQPTQSTVAKSQSKAPVSSPQLSESLMAPPPSLDVYQARSAALNQAENEVSGSSVAGDPALDEALRQNLRTVNEFIAECQAHLKKHPHDTLAREYLNSAYQQKAELLAAMLDSGRSEQ
jgi:hypothetical protein